MRYRQLFWMTVGIFFLVETGQIGDVYGMPLHLSMGGSNVCDFDFGALPGLKQRSRITYEIVFRNSASFIANSSYCNLEIWNDGEKMNNPAENKRSSRKLRVRLEIENPEQYKIYVDRADETRFPVDVNFIMQIICPNRKFKDCIHFPKGREGAHVQRRLLSVGQLYMNRDPKDDIPFQPIILLVAGVVILVIAGSLCTGCNANKDDESVSEARPELVAVRGRSSVQNRPKSQEQNVQEGIVVESKDDVVVETAQNVEGDAVDAGNHVALYDEPVVSVRPVPSHVTGVQHVVANSVEHVPISVQHVENHLQHVPTNVPEVPPTSVDHVTEGDHKSGKKKRGSKHDHENDEQRGKFWKRTRSSKKNATGLNDQGPAADGVFKDIEHKHNDKRSRKESKEQKAKLHKSKDRKSSNDSDEKKALDEDHRQRPREATPTLERHSRGLPAPPPPGVSHGSALPDRPIPQRQISAPGGTGLEEDTNYETVEVRKTKSVERVEVTVDDNYDTVQVEDGKPGPPSSAQNLLKIDNSGSKRDSDLYEVVESTSHGELTDELYDKVEDDETRNKEQKQRLGDEEMDEDEEDPEDPYSRIKMLRGSIGSDNSDVYEEIDKRLKSDENTVEDSVAKNGLLDVRDTESIRNRSKSDSAGLRRPQNDFFKRSNTIDVVRPKQGEVTRPLDYVYAEVDLSKKTKRGPNPESNTVGEKWGDDNPPPLPPVYVSSKQIKIEMERNEGSEDGLYDEVGPSTSEKQRSPNMELSLPECNTDETNRLSGVSGDYELVEVKHDVTPVDDGYSGLVDEGPRPKVGSCGSAGPEHVEIRSAPVDTSAVVSGSNEATEEGDENDGAHYEMVTPRKLTRELSNLDWV